MWDSPRATETWFCFIVWRFLPASKLTVIIIPCGQWVRKTAYVLWGTRSRGTETICGKPWWLLCLIFSYSVLFGVCSIMMTCRLQQAYPTPWIAMALSRDSVIPQKAQLTLSILFLSVVRLFRTTHCFWVFPDYPPSDTHCRNSLRQSHHGVGVFWLPARKICNERSRYSFLLKIYREGRKLF